LLGFQGVSEAEHLLLVAMVGLVIALMLAVMIVQKRWQVAKVLLAEDLPDSSLRVHLVRAWHLLAIFYVFGTWAVWAISLLLVGPREVLAAVVTILCIPVYMFLTWGVDRLLALATVQPEAQMNSSTSAAIYNAEVVFQDNDFDEAMEFEPPPEQSQFTRHIPLIRRSFRIFACCSAVFLNFEVVGD
jgi:hypothetical protein